jgi:hypothetical protein
MFRRPFFTVNCLNVAVALITVDHVVMVLKGLDGMPSIMSFR